MQRKPGFPVANCNIKMPDGMPAQEPVPLEEDSEQAQRRQQLINFGHAQWGFNNWSWSVTKQDLDFVDFTNGKYCAGVVAFVSVMVKSLDIHRENIGYATTLAANKGIAIYKSRKCAVTNALKETLLSFGGNVATELTDLLDSNKNEYPTPAPEPLPENNPNVSNVANNLPKLEVKNVKNIRKDSVDGGATPVVINSASVSAVNPVNPVNPMNPVNNPRPLVPSAVKNAVPPPPPMAKAHPIPAVPPANRVLAAPRPPPPPIRPNSNDSRPLESMSEEEARAERKRRQQRAQEEFRRQQMMKDEKQELQKTSTSFDNLLMDIPTQDIEIDPTGETEQQCKRKSPGPDAGAKRRPGVFNRLDIVSTD